MSGDEGADVVTTTGTTSKWVYVIVNEDSTSSKDIKLRATLTSPANADFDLYIYATFDGTCGGAVTAKSTLTSSVDTAGVKAGDSWGVDDWYYAAIEVRNVSGTCDSASPWTLKLEGNK